VAKDDSVLSADSRTVVMSEDHESTGLDILLKMKGVTHPSTSVIGVDPGMTFGLALLVDGIVISKRSVSSPLDAANLTIDWIRYISVRFPGLPLLVRIGTGSKLFSVLYLRDVPDNGPHLIQMVDEHHTSVACGAESDKSSAVIIAKRAGRAVLKSDYAMLVREGHVRTLKRLWVQLTGGRINLSNDNAVDIIEGRRTLRSLLSEQG
jgi:hypothetical protein